MPNIEIERKFLVLNEDYKQLATSHYTIQQGYICKEPDRTVRVRIRTEADGSGTAFLTIKSKPNAMGFSRFEWEKEIAVLDAQQLMELCLKVFGSFQSVRILPQALRHCSIQHDIAAGDTVGGTQGPEFKLVSGKCKWRRTVTVCGVP